MLAALAAAPPAAGQALPDSARRAIDQVFAAFDRADAPGCALAVYRDGTIAYAAGYGMANLDLGAAISPATVFDIGSLSKQFTAFAVHLLAADGKLSLDDPVRRWVPELSASADRITLRHMVHHTSGLRDYLTLMALAGTRFDDVTDFDDALRLLARQRETNFPPGTEYLYSNSGYLLLDAVVERASGRSLRDFADERIFGPLGMRHTHFHDDHAMIVPGRATGYTPRDGAWAVDMSGFEQTGDGAVYTTVEDLARWNGNFTSASVGGPAVIKAMQVPGKLADGSALDYAAGLRVGAWRGVDVVEHGGSWAGYRAAMTRYPDHRLAVSVLCNRTDARASRRVSEVAEVLLQAQLAAAGVGERPSASANLPDAVVASRAGIWVSPGTGEILRLQAQGGTLREGFGTGTPLVPQAADRFQAPDGTEYHFATTPAESVLELWYEGRKYDHLVRKDPFAPGPEGLEPFAGRYRSEELDVVWDLAPVGDSLLVTIRGRRLTALRPAYDDAFSDGRIHAVFHRDPRHRIKGLTIMAGRVRNIRFEAATP